MHYSVKEHVQQKICSNGLIFFCKHSAIDTLVQNEHMSKKVFKWTNFSFMKNVWLNSITAISAVWDKNTLFLFSFSSTAVLKDFVPCEILKGIFVVF